MNGSTLVAVFLVTFVFIALAVGAMAAGSRMTGRCLRGSCGGPQVHDAEGRKICPGRAAGWDHTAQ